jgi:hypothetical protein
LSVPNFSVAIFAVTNGSELSGSNLCCYKLVGSWKNFFRGAVHFGELSPAKFLTVFLSVLPVLPVPSTCRPSSVVRGSSAVVHRPSSIVRSPSSVVRGPSAIVRRPSSIVRCPSSVARRPSSVVRRPWSVGCRPSSVVHRPLSVVCRPLSVVRRPSSVVRRPWSVGCRPSSVVHRPFSVVRQQKVSCGHTCHNCTARVPW